MKILLQTDRLILRRFTEADIDDLFDLDNDPEVMRYINGGIPTPHAVIRDERLPRFLHYDEDFPGCGFWAAIEKQTLVFLGWFSFRPMAGTVEEIKIGYRFRKTAWGKGYATEGARVLMHKGFAEFGVQRIVATTYEENHASRRVMEKLGMTLRRTFRLTSEDLMNADTYHTMSLEPWNGDDVEYVLEKAAWVRQQNRRAG